MSDDDSSWILYYPSNNLAAAVHLLNVEQVLRSPLKTCSTNINEVLELYNIKKYIDTSTFLDAWTPQDIMDFQCRVASYSNVIGTFTSGIDDTNLKSFFNATHNSYVPSFWELFNAHSIAKRISADVFKDILLQKPYLINLFLTYSNIVNQYQVVLREFLLEYSGSADLLLLIYGIRDSSNQNAMCLPKNLTPADKKLIISNYLDSSETNFHSVRLIHQMKDLKGLTIDDGIRLRAKRLYSRKIEDLQEHAGASHYACGAAVGFQENTPEIVNFYIENGIAHYIYSLDYIKNNSAPYQLFLNFKYLFGYLDGQNRITLVANAKNLGLFERMNIISSQHEYIQGISFTASEMTSQQQIIAYNHQVNNLKTTLEDIISYMFGKLFSEKYGFADNAKFSITTARTYVEKVRLLGPEFESILKQFKLFVEEGHIDFELLQISSNSCSIKDIPSLNEKKYFYLSEGNEVIINCLHLFFSDQTALCYVEPNQNDQYIRFFDLLINEDVKYGSYEEYQRDTLDLLIGYGFIEIDNDFIVITNPERLLILRDLHDNDVGSFYNFDPELRQEIERMASENIVYFQSSLFSRPEQSYFNYYLNKEFTNGLNLRNSYIHGTQTQNVREHESNYFSYLKLIFLALLKMEDDLHIYRFINSATLDS